jgi:hypothetical protein
VFRLLPYAVAVHTSRNLRHIDVGGYLAYSHIELIEKIGKPVLELAAVVMRHRRIRFPFMLNGDFSTNRRVFSASRGKASWKVQRSLSHHQRLSFARTLSGMRFSARPFVEHKTVSESYSSLAVLLRFAYINVDPDLRFEILKSSIA